MKISIITTAFNEEKNILPFYRSLKKALNKKIDYELIIVNDGSTDKTLEEIKKIKDENIKILNQKHQGKDFALYHALNTAQSQIISTIDCDLQNDPNDIPRLLKKINQDFDFVCGWRHQRKDNFIKKIFSKIGNFLLFMFFGLKLHDNNCPVKIFKKKCLEEIIFFRHFHRFLTVLAKIQGYKICEEKVNHFPRIYGKSKYGFRNRIFGNLKTFLMIKFRKENFFKNKYQNENKNI